MTDILLITDVPRLTKVFSRVNDETNISLRIASRLEHGGEEIAAKKPDMIFVQTHLSGFSGDILLMHLKKQLGRRRSRFVLMCTTESVAPEILKLYKYSLDTSLPDNELFDAINGIIRDAFAKDKKESSPPSADTISTATENLDAELPVKSSTTTEDFIPMLDDNPDVLHQRAPDNAEDTNQLITYAPPSRLKVYSEFSSSFETAVSNYNQSGNQEPINETEATWIRPETPNDIETISTRSRRMNFLLWLAPLLLAVLAVTMVQHRSPKTSKVDVAPGLSPAPNVTGQTSPAVPPAAVTPPEAKNEQKKADSTVISALSKTTPAKEPMPAVKKAKRPVALPSFIPKYGYDKSYGLANPGWERYKGQITEFRVFRENGAIKAIQVIDQGGLGVPESFMRGVLRQLTNKPDFTVKSSAKKDGYEIQRGHPNENISAVYYRDSDGGKLRAFVVTWY